MNRIFQQSYHIPGTLTADLNIRFTAPCNCTLLHVSAVGSNANDATLTIGDSADTDGYLAACTIGGSDIPVEKKAWRDFAGGQFPRIDAGAVVVLTLDHDGAGGAAAADVTITLTFAEG
jgi:hypothetical protein